MSKKIISLLLCLLLLVSLLSTGVMATGTEPTDEALTLYGFRLYGNDTTAPQAFVSIPSQTPAQPQVLAEQADLSSVYAGTYAGGYFYGVDSEGKLFSTTLDAFARTYIGAVIEDTTKWRAAELTYDYANGRLILLAQNLQTDVRTGTLYAVDTATAAVTQLCQIGNDLAIHALAADPSGKLYGIDSQGDLYTIDMSTGTPAKIGSTGHALGYHQSMTFERQTGRLYWARYSVGGGVLCLVNTTTAEVTDIGVIGDNAQITGLCMPEDAFLVRFEYETGGSAGDNGTGYYQSGDRISLTATPDKGYTFGGWEASAGVLSSTGEETCTLVMPTPGQDIIVKAYFVPSNRYTERTVRDNNAGITVTGSSIYYNATVTVSDLTEGDAYNRILAKTKNKEIVDAFALNLEPHAVQGSVLAHKGNITVSVRVDAAYEGKKMTIWQVSEDKVVKATGTVRDGLLTYKTSTVAPIAITPSGGVSFVSVLLILVLILLLGVVVIWLLHLRHMKRLRARQAARTGKPQPKKKSLRTRIGNWLRARRKK